MTGHLAEPLPIFFGLDGNYTPAIVALAAVSAVRRGKRTEVALRLRLASVGQPFEIRGPEHRSRGFCLREIDVLPLAGPGAVMDCGDNGKRSIRRRNVVGKRSLGSCAGFLYFRVAPQ